MTTSKIEILNEHECYEIVRNSLQLSENVKINIKSWDLKQSVNDLVGFLGEYYKLTIMLVSETVNYDKQEQTLQYFVKTVPYTNEYHRNECMRKGFFNKEAVIYTEILPHIQRYAPQKLYPVCYYTREDLLVLEDLTTDYKHLAFGESYTMAHYRVVLRMHAVLHAASIAWELKEGLQIGERFKSVLRELHLATNNEWYMAGIKGVVYLAKRHPKFQTVKAQKFINDQLFEKLCQVKALTEPSNRFCNVLCHRDTWDRNVLYKFDDCDVPSECAIVDFQLTRYCSPALDVLFMLYITATAEFRRQNEATCLDFYFEQLQKCFVALDIDPDHIRKADFFADCQRVRLAAIVGWTICEPLMRMPQGLVSKMRAAEPEQFDHYMNHDCTEFFDRMMSKDTQYANLVMDSVGELLDYLLENE